MIPDYECTLWPDIFNGFSIQDCCIAHDLSTLPMLAADWELAKCVVEVNPFLLPVAVVMFVGLSTLGVIYRRTRKHRGD